MQGASLIIPLLLGLLGLLCIGYLLRVLWISLIGDPAGLLERFKFRQKENLLSRADVYIKAAEFESAYSFLRGSFLLDQIKSDIRLVTRLHNHHLAILGRLVGIADRFSAHLDSLPIVEDLLTTRSQLMKSFIEKKIAQQSLAQKNRGKNRPPDWALSEFRNQAKEIREKLAVNRKSLDSQLSKLFLSLGSAKKHEEVTYH